MKGENTISPGRIRKYTAFQLFTLVLLRMLIGWHFLYEGIAKLLNPYWTSAGYLTESRWLFSGFFTSIAENPSLLKAVDFLNVWGQIAIGLALITGLLTSWALIAGIFLLSVYYVCNPPFVGYSYTVPSEGSYLIVNKILIEMAALGMLLAFPTARIFGLDRLISRRRSRNATKTRGSGGENGVG
jgi:thiosulfate dehydrogenase [quinone] large subunit